MEQIYDKILHNKNHFFVHFWITCDLWKFCQNCEPLGKCNLKEFPNMSSVILYYIYLVITGDPYNLMSFGFLQCNLISNCNIFCALNGILFPANENWTFSKKTASQISGLEIKLQESQYSLLTIHTILCPKLHPFLFA